MHYLVDMALASFTRTPQEGIDFVHGQRAVQRADGAVVAAR
jgi:hypothetical protein